MAHKLKCRKKTTTTINRCRKKCHDSFSLLNRCHNSVNSENAEHKTLGFDSGVLLCQGTLFLLIFDDGEIL